MLTAAAIVPTPPLLVPEVAGAAQHDDELRQSALDVVRALGGSGAERVVVLGAAPATQVLEGSWDMRPWGVAHPPRPPQHRLPLALAIGDWLLDTAGSSLPRVHQGLAPDADTRALADSLVNDVPTALLVCADGSACRDPKAPGHFNERAHGFDADLERALRTADTAALTALDPALAGELLVTGLPAFQVLAQAQGARGQRWTARVPLVTAPYGVLYVTALWTPARP